MSVPAAGTSSPGPGPGAPVPPGAWIGLALIAFVLASRVLLLPLGPWEQDEALFASGVIDFDLRRHSPHPPGFPGWIGLGKALHLFIADPLLCLRLLSSLASVFLFVGLARLMAPRVGGPLAVAGALLVSFVPGVWAHAPRAFSSTPALACGVGALWCWQRASQPGTALQKGGVLAGWGLLGLAAAIRPQLVPTLVVVGIAGVWLARRRPWLLAHGLLLGLGVTAAAYLRVVMDTGGLAETLALLRSHYGHHMGDVAHRGAVDFVDLGLVRGLGGPIPALAWFGLALVGAVRLLRGFGWWGRWLVLLAITTGLSVHLLHHPGFPRYSVATVITSAPLVLVAVSAFPARAAIAGTWLFALVSLGATLPAMMAMHHHRLPVMQALARLEDGSKTDLLYSHGLFSFVRYARDTGELTRPIVDHGSGRKAPRRRGPFDMIGPTDRPVLPGLTARLRTFDVFPEAAWDLSQRRFDAVQVLRNPVWLGRDVNHIEVGRHDDPFAWLGARARLELPGGADTLELELELNEGLAPQRIIALVAGQKRVDVRFADPGVWRVSVPLDGCGKKCRVDLELPLAQQPGHERRLLSMRLRAAWVQGPRFEIDRRRFSPGRVGSLLASGVTLEGFYGPDQFMRTNTPGAWARGHASMHLPAVDGWLRLRLARPKHLSGPVHLDGGAQVVDVDVGTKPADVWVRLVPRGGEARVDLDAPSFVPRRRDAASKDARELALIVLEAELVPAAQVRAWPPVTF